MPATTWTWRGRLGVIFAGVWFLLTGAIQLLGVGIPGVLMALIALLAGILLLIGA